MVSQHLDANTTFLSDKGPMGKINSRQLPDLKKSQRDADSIDTTANLLVYQPKTKLNGQLHQTSHHYGAKPSHGS